MNTLIWFFFHDAICRLIPGIIVIGLYWNHLVIRAHVALKKEYSLFLAMCIVLIAWLIGATLDTVTFSPWYRIPQVAQVLKLNIPQTNVTQTAGNNIVDKGDRGDIEKYWLVQRIRITAEIVLFRIMMVISAFIILWPPINLGVKSKWLRFYGLIGTIVFGLCWWFGRQN
ncbi:MAG: hypothetical protein ABSG80_11410 [Verrucomicrobiota bacterium]|jgi:hypothetical protein